MNSFEVIYSEGKQIVIKSNTHWSAKAVGGFTLSQYSGNGDAVIDIIIPDDIAYAQGNVFFSFGTDYRTDNKFVFVYLENENYFRIVPKEITLNGRGSTASAMMYMTRTNEVSNESDKVRIIQYGEDKLLIVSATNDSVDIGKFDIYAIKTDSGVTFREYENEPENFICHLHQGETSLKTPLFNS